MARTTDALKACAAQSCTNLFSPKGRKRFCSEGSKERKGLLGFLGWRPVAEAQERWREFDGYGAVAA